MKKLGKFKLAKDLTIKLDKDRLTVSLQKEIEYTLGEFLDTSGTMIRVMGADAGRNLNLPKDKFFNYFEKI